MSPEPPQISILDARLAEIDRRLGVIQTDLLDQAAPDPQGPTGQPPALPPRIEIPEPSEAAGASAPPAPMAEQVAGLRGLAVAHRRLLESLQQLVDSYERTLTQNVAPPPTAGKPTQFSVSAGPFTSTEAVHGFERTLERIPEVRDVQVRGYEGEDRAIVDVHLHDSTS